MVRPNVKTLIEEQVKDMGSAKVQLSIWIMWKKKVELAVEVDGAQDLPSNNDAYIKVEKVF